MSNFLCDFEDKVEEINEYFNLIKNLDDNDLRKIRVSTSLSATLKANCYLLLYNLIEGSVMAAIDSIFIAINEHVPPVSFEVLNERYKQKWLSYKYALIKHIGNKGNKIQEMQNTPLTIGNALRDIALFRIYDYQEGKVGDGGRLFDNYYSYLKTQDEKSEFSGNLDLRKIREIADKYNIKIPKENYVYGSKKGDPSIEGHFFSKITKSRNELAHGEYSFSEIGQRSTLQEIEEMKESVITYLRKLLQNIDTFITSEGYLAR